MVKLFQGLLPVQFLNLTENEISQALFSNARQMVAQFNEKRIRTKENTWSFLYKPFSNLIDDILDHNYKNADSAQRKKNYQGAVSII